MPFVRWSLPPPLLPGCPLNTDCGRLVYAAVLVTHDGHAKLADFGSAKEVAGAAETEASLHYQYTPLWTAPEVVRGAYSAKVDLWSFGCVCLEMATAELPFAECKFTSPYQVCLN